MNKAIGIALVILGAMMLIWTGFTYTKKEKIIDAGPIQVSADRQKAVTWPPYVGALLLAGGIVVIVTSKKVPVNLPNQARCYSSNNFNSAGLTFNCPALGKRRVNSRQFASLA